MSTISIKYCDIPTWLKAGGLYRSLSPANVEDIITIPAGCFMVETSECWTDENDNLAKFSQLIRIVVHWMLDEMPVGVLEFCVKHDADIWQDTILSVPGAKESKVLAPLLDTVSTLNQALFRIAMKTGNAELIGLAAGKFYNRIAATAIAAEEGNLPVLQLLHEQLFPWNKDICWKASQYGHLDCLQYAHENGCPWDRFVYTYAAKGGHLHIMQYAYQQGLRKWHEDVCAFAAQVGHIACLQFAHENGCPWNYEVFKYAAANGHLHCMQYAHQQGLREWRIDVCELAAREGELDCLQFAYDNGCPWDEETTEQAALSGQLPTLRYAMEQGCPYNDYMIMSAVMNGSIDCIRYLVEEQGMHMNYAVFTISLLKGNFSCLQYLMDQGCPFLTATYASVTLREEYNEWIFPKDNSEFTQCVQYAVERGWKLNQAFCKYISSRDPKCTAYLRSEGLFVDTISILYRDIPKWLQKGDFYRNLSPENPEDVVCIPADCYTQDNDWNVDDKDLYDFPQLIRVAMFWILDEIPFGILQVCAQYPAEEWRDAMLSVPGVEESEIFVPLLGVYPFDLEESFALIIRTGKLELILRAAKIMCNANKATAIAVQERNLLALKLLHEQGFAWNEETCSMASRNGYLDCLQYAHENDCPWDYLVYEWAARNGHLHIMKYAHQQGLEWHVNVCKFAASEDQLECLQFAHENGCPWDDASVSYAATNGHLTCLQFLLERGCPISKRACESACENGQLLCLQLLHEYNAPWDELTCECAALCSDVSCLQFLHEHDCPWDERTPYTAAKYGHLTVLRYAMELGCPHDDQLMECVARYGSMECLRYLVEVQVLYMSTNVFIYALLGGELARVQYLIDQGCPYLNTFAYNLDLMRSHDREKQYIKGLQYYVRNPLSIKVNSEFTQCVQYAVERGWTANRSFCKFVNSRNVECKAYLKSERLFLINQNELKSIDTIDFNSLNLPYYF